MKLQDLIEQALRTTLDVLDAENGSLLLADPDKRTARVLSFHRRQTGASWDSDPLDARNRWRCLSVRAKRKL